MPVTQSSQIASLANIAQNYLTAGSEGKRWGTEHASIVPYQMFSTADGRAVVAAGNEGQYKKLCSALSDTRLLKSRFKTNADRVANREELVCYFNQISIISEILSTEPTAHWAAIFRPLSIPFGPVNDLKQTFEHPQVVHRKVVQEIEHPTVTLPKTGWHSEACRTSCNLQRV
jgi:succinate---hydroxymethylglutarate CoA-transferase